SRSHYEPWLFRSSSCSDNGAAGSKAEFKKMQNMKLERPWLFQKLRAGGCFDRRAPGSTRVQDHSRSIGQPMRLGQRAIKVCYEIFPANLKVANYEAGHTNLR